ncbi:hypothetical protein BABINDRAFT_160274 [Babjeviella inositovora NRRL Y-12698]|uniref:DUF1748-domain-containing protein n=1 Tax=Babjeviella inositovora NRRL Y-12698 TaxID=984486 RepID=A0A1E3QWN8_9ASCO|nr:uncharacterized protein BABINDRAFT_160274 [Babjeviella inositovora NRRL Y-12698]ODQ82076.1 hypothetical protein BABINDRAFT_160274 [Babjeviella inositovora NRRL Y-12698]
MGITKYIHYSIDLVLVSIVLAGIRRNTGLTFNADEFHSMDARRYISKFLGLGERMYDYTVSLVRHSGYFYQRSLKDEFTDELKKNFKKKANEFDIPSARLD